jgi:hypothetical protein
MNTFNSGPSSSAAVPGLAPISFTETLVVSLFPFSPWPLALTLRGCSGGSSGGSDESIKSDSIDLSTRLMTCRRDVIESPSAEGIGVEDPEVDL